MQRIPAGLPACMPGIVDEMEGAIQQAAQPDRHSMSVRQAAAARVDRLARNRGLAQAAAGLGDTVPLAGLAGYGPVDVLPATVLVMSRE